MLLVVLLLLPLITFSLDNFFPLPIPWFIDQLFHLFMKYLFSCWFTWPRSGKILTCSRHYTYKLLKMSFFATNTFLCSKLETSRRASWCGEWIKVISLYLIYSQISNQTFLIHTGFLWALSFCFVALIVLSGAYFSTMWHALLQKSFTMLAHVNNLIKSDLGKENG